MANAEKDGAPVPKIKKNPVAPGNSKRKNSF